jgi:ComF family protein
VRALDFLMPERCAICDIPGRGALCAKCTATLTRLRPPVCERCGCPGAWPVRRCAECAGRRLAFARARSAIVYEARSRAIVSAWKERGRRALTTTLAELVADVVAPPAVDALAPVPGDRERGRERGHVPAVRLAEALGARWHLPVRMLLTRTGVTSRRQAGLTRNDRRANVRAAFTAVRAAPRHVGLVDDVYTTGATASACASELRRAGAARVEVVCLARAVR